MGFITAIRSKELRITKRNSPEMLLFTDVVRCAFLSFAAATAFASPVTDHPTKTERDLRHDLFKDYDKLVRPVENPATPINVEASVTPLMIRDVDEKHQNIVLETYFLMKWKDDYLRWDPSNYDNITSLRLPSSEVWKPDLTLYTTSPDTSLFPTLPTQVVIFPTGDILWVPMYTIRSRCPLPTQNKKSYVDCNMRIGSWTYSSKELNPQLFNSGVDMTNFQDINPDWKLLELKSSRESKYYPCCPGEEYPVLHFNATLKRRSSGYDKNEIFNTRL